MKRIRTTQINRILENNYFIDTNNSVNVFKKEAIIPDTEIKEITEAKQNVKPEVISKDPNIKPVYHNQLPNTNVEIIKKQDKPSKDTSALSKKYRRP